MPNRSSNETPAAKLGVGNRSGKRGRGPQEPDLNETAFSVLQQATGEIEKQEPKLPAVKKTVKQKNAAAVTLGRLGGLKGGKARADKLTPEQRKEIARKAAEKRWGAKE
jgi:hypothetical protein